MSDVLYWLWLAALPGLTDRRRWQLLEQWKTPAAVYEHAPATLPPENGRGKAVQLDRSLTAAQKIMDNCRRRNIRVLTYEDNLYPRRLWDIFAPPPVLYAMGQVRQLDDEAAVAVVGTRKASLYGQKAAETIGRDLSRLGLTVVSGMAKGIDGCALWGAVRGGGYPVAVLGSGPDVCYPAENRELYEAILRQGMVLSAYPPGTKPERWHFPERNRIISGVTLGTLVAEAPAGRSGALLTADSAAEQGRDVFALPAAVDNPAGAGCLELLRQGAILVRGAEDAAENYRYRFPHKIKDTLPPEEPAPQPVSTARPAKAPPQPEPLPDLPPEQLAVLEALSGGPLPADEAALAANIPVTDALSALTVLEIEGYVYKTGARYARSPHHE